MKSTWIKSAWDATTKGVKWIAAFLTSKSVIALVLGIGFPMFIAWRATDYVAEMGQREKKLQQQADSTIRAKADSTEQAKVLLAERISAPPPGQGSMGAAVKEETNASSVKLLPPFRAVPPRDSTTANLSAVHAGKIRAWEFEKIGIKGGIFIILLVLLFVAYSKQSNLKAEWEKDSDPDELIRLFDKFKPEIIKLSTPRKIKRFFNKVRIQYNLLKKMGALTEEESEEFILALLVIDKHRNVLLTGDFETFAQLLYQYMYPPPGTKTDDQTVVNVIQSAPGKKMNLELYGRIYRLNRDVIV